MEKTQSEYSVVKQQKRDLYAKMYIMDFNFNILDEISGVVLTCSFTNNANSQLRRSCSISISPTDSSFDISYGNKLWLDKYIKIETGIKDIHTGDVAYTNRGIYLINNPSRVYSAINNTIDIQGLDLMSKLTGERNGNLKGMTYIIPANTFSYSAIVAILAEGGFTQYALDYWNCPYTPNEISIDIGGTLYDLLNAILEIDSMMQMYFDVNGVFHYEKIPITAEEQIIIDDDIWTDVLIDYKQDTNYDEVKNSIEVFGKTHDITNYDATATMTEVSGARTINVTLSGVTDYPSGLMFGVIFTSATIPQRQITYLEINSASPLILNNNRVYDADDMYFEQNIIYVFRIASGSFDDILHPCIQYMGGLQPYAKIEETNSTSPFYVDGTMGTVRKVLNNGEYDNISTDLMASERANWELYQRCRVQDSIIIKCVPIYWADVNTVIEITPPNKNGTEETNRYMIKSISDSYGVDEIQTINAMKYFPYYTDYEPDMEGIYDTVNLFVPIEEYTTESIALSVNFYDANTTIDWGDSLSEISYITSDTRYDKDYVYDDLPDSLIYIEDGITYKGVWIKIKAPRTEVNYLKLDYQTQNITKFYANVGDYQTIYDVENLTELKLIGNLNATSLSGYTNLETIYMELENDSSTLRFLNFTSLKTVELDIPNITSTTYMFQGCTSLESATLTSTSNVLDMKYMFNGCTSLTSALINDTSNVTDTTYMFYDCTSLSATPTLNTSSVVYMNYMFMNCTNLINVYNLDMTSTTTTFYMFKNCTSLKSITTLDTNNVSSLSGIFENCTALETVHLDVYSESLVNNIFLGCTSIKNITVEGANDYTKMLNLFIDISDTIEYVNLSDLENIIGLYMAFDNLLSLKTIILNGTKNVTDMNYMFNGNILLESVTIDDTSSVTGMSNMFNECESLKDISELDLTNVTDITDMFSGCVSLENISLVNVNSITSMSSMFKDLESLESVDISGTSIITNMSYMFDGCTSLQEISLLDTSNVLYTQYMFRNCTSLTTIPQLDTSSVIDAISMFYGCTSLQTIPLINIENVINAYGLFEDCSSLISIPELNTSNATDVRYMFKGCSSLTSVPILDILNATSMYGMFYDCTSLTEIPLLNTINITDMSHAFRGCSLISTLPLLNTSNVTNMHYMLFQCYSFVNMPLLDTSKVINMSTMFDSCISLETIPLLDTSIVTNMSYMFDTCNSLTTIPQLDTSSVLYMHYMFDECISLITIPLIDMSNATNTAYMFRGCVLLEEVPLLDILNVTNTQHMFDTCNSLTTIPQLDLTSCISMEGMFNSCTSISTIDLINAGVVSNTDTTLLGCLELDTITIGNLKYNITLPNTNKLTATALNALFTSLGDVTSSSKTITITGSLGASTCDQTIATAKGWVVVN